MPARHLSSCELYTPHVQLALCLSTALLSARAHVASSRQGTLVSGSCSLDSCHMLSLFFFQAEDGIRDLTVTGVQTCALPISPVAAADVHAEAQAIAAALLRGERKAILLGNAAAHHAQASTLLSLANWIAEQTDRKSVV